MGSNLPNYKTPMQFAYITTRLNLKQFFHKSESIPFNQSVVIIDPRWKHPFPALVAGLILCGKSQFVKRSLECGEGIIDGTPENIIWCYGIYQPTYDEMLRSVPNITFVEGIPGDLESMINPSIRNLVVIDYLMHKLGY